MLVSFRVKNFKSIVDATLDLRYGEGKAPNGYAEMDRLPFLQDAAPANASKNARPLRVVPVLGIYGQNAGGKSTLVEALRTFWEFVCGLNARAERGVLPFYPNVLHPELQVTEYSIESSVESEPFRYTLAHMGRAVQREELWHGNRRLFLIDYEHQEVELAEIATEAYPESRIRSILDVECTTPDGFQRCPLLTKLGTNYGGLRREIFSLFEDFFNLFILLDNHIRPDMGLLLLSNEIKGTSVESAFYEIASYMTKLDIGIARMELSPEARESINTYKEPTFYCADEGDHQAKPKSAADSIYTYHRRTDGELVPLRLRDESRGSQVLFGLLGVLLAALHSGGTVVIDELDRSIHPLVLKSLVALFTDKTYNKHNAQLIFTAHNTELLDGDELRLSEVGIVTKTAQNGTTLRRLCDFEGVRNVKNFRLGYLDGYFSGIPFPSI